jgi:hypothetical protein
MSLFFRQGAGVIATGQCSVNGTKTLVSMDAYVQSTVTIALTSGIPSPETKWFMPWPSDKEGLEPVGSG